MGKTPTYLANNIFRLDAGSKLTEDKELGINGFMVTLTLVKSRSNRAGQTVDLVFEQERGFSNYLSNYVHLKKENLIGGAGRSFYLNSYPDVKFSQKELISKLESNKEFRKAFIIETRNSLKKFINVSSVTHDKSEDPDLDEDSLDSLNISDKVEIDEDVKKSMTKAKK